jgi:UDP-4-amino-4-deoxy-L-arabinose formyltransferase/UDP-glucuronic acid dehydrogenase (UDP-4-keto-hexauronic acid decarboxylating)
MPRYVILGDESTLPAMARLLEGHVALAVAASTRPQSANLAGTGALNGVEILAQPPMSSEDRPRFETALRDIRPDLFLCFSYSMVLTPDLLAIPARGAINIHGGLLPRYRGANILNWVLIEGVAVTGVTAHYMTPGIDEGDIVLQERIPIDDSDTAVSLKQRLDAAGLRLVAQLHGALMSGEALPREPQDGSAARYYRRRRPEDGRIDWSRSDREIHDLVRALVHPWPGAYYFDKCGRKVTVDRYLTMEEVHRLRNEHGG